MVKYYKTNRPVLGHRADTIIVDDVVLDPKVSFHQTKLKGDHMEDSATILHLHLAHAGVMSAMEDMRLAEEGLREYFDGRLPSDTEAELRAALGRLDSALLLLQVLPATIGELIETR